VAPSANTKLGTKCVYNYAIVPFAWRPIVVINNVSNKTSNKDALHNKRQPSGNKNLTKQDKTKTIQASRQNKLAGKQCKQVKASNARKMHLN